MKRRIVLHIGLERTGTSALQRFLSRNRAALRLMGVRYPRPVQGPTEKHHDLVEAIAAEASGAPNPDLGPAEALIMRPGP